MADRSSRETGSASIGGFLPPFDRPFLYEDGRFPVSFSLALQKMMQLHLWPGSRDYGGFLVCRDFVYAEFPLELRQDFPPSLIREPAGREGTVLLLLDRKEREIRWALRAGGALSAYEPEVRDETSAPLLFALLALGLDREETGLTFEECLEEFEAFREQTASGENGFEAAVRLKEKAAALFARLSEDPELQPYAEERETPLLLEPSSVPCRPEGPCRRAGAVELRKEARSGRTGISAIRGKYRPDDARVLSAEEESLIPRIPENHPVPEQVRTAAAAVKYTSPDLLPFRNFLFRGEAGTGKTEAARMLACACGLPYVFLTCSSDTEIYDLLMQLIPCTGADGGISYRTVDSPLVTALEKGWLVEIQEPSVISKPGVLAGLNAVWDQTGEVRLLDGRIVRRHPDCVIVMTTNASYEGCRRMNQSVISRQQLVMEFDLPADEDLLRRVETLSGLRDRGMLRRMIEVKHRADEVLAENAASDGDTGVRQLVNWAVMARITGKPYASALNTLLCAATCDPDLRVDMIHALESQFSPADDGDGGAYA